MIDGQPTLLVTGGAGFIGSNLVRMLLEQTEARVVNLDLLTYAGRTESLGELLEHPRHEFVRGNIGDAGLVADLFAKWKPRAILHLAAESHVDRSIDGPNLFVQTNVVGTAVLLRASLDYWEASDTANRDAFRFLHVSTDEVFGSLAPGDPPFTERSRYDPSSPYAASKAASDHLVRSFGRTYGLPVIVTNSSNNYGPAQFPEKLIPLMILRAMADAPLPLYGDGQQVRDWIHVEDQCRALMTILQRGGVGESYNVGSDAELTNQQVVEMICDAVDARRCLSASNSTRRLITRVADRPGHDRRYGIDASKLRSLGWSPTVDFRAGLASVLAWYAENADWVAAATQENPLSQRLGLRNR